MSFQQEEQNRLLVQNNLALFEGCAVNVAELAVKPDTKLTKDEQSIKKLGIIAHKFSEGTTAYLKNMGETSIPGNSSFNTVGGTKALVYIVATSESELGFQKGSLGFGFSTKGNTKSEENMELKNLCERATAEVKTAGRAVYEWSKDSSVIFKWSVLKSPWPRVQEPHIDDHPNSKVLRGLGFGPLTSAGMYLQVWPSEPDGRAQGMILFIPLGWMIVSPMTLVHGGGFKTNVNENLRMHFYFYYGEDKPPLNLHNHYKCNIEGGPEECPYANHPSADLMSGVDNATANSNPRRASLLNMVLTMQPIGESQNL
jgi:hypothetical protein